MIINKTSKKYFFFFISALIFSPLYFIAAQSDGSTPPSGDTGTADAVAPAAPAEAVPTEAAPRPLPSEGAATPAPAAAVSPASQSGETPKTSPDVSLLPVSESQENQPTSPASAPNPTPAPTPTTSLAGSSTAPENSNPYSFLFAVLAAFFLAVSYGIIRMLFRNIGTEPVSQSEKKTGGRCDEIKALLERKKNTLEIISGTLSLKEALIDFLTKKIEAKKEELKDEVTTVVVDTVVGKEGGEIIRSAQEVKENYDELLEKLEQAKAALEYFTRRQKQTSEEVGRIEAAYQTCLLGDSVFTGASRLGAGLEMFESSLRQKLYRYTSREKDVFSHDAVLAENLAELAEAGKWLPAPELPEGKYRFFLTEKGKAEYEKKLFLLHKKYLPDIFCEETDSSQVDTVVYEDEWQVVARNDGKAQNKP